MTSAFSYTDLAATAKQHKFVIPVSIAAFVCAALLWLNCVTPCYTAEMIIGPVLQTTAVTNDQKIMREMESDEVLSDYARAVQLLVSPEIAEQILKDKQLNVRSHLIQNNGWGQALKSFIWRIAGQNYKQAQDASTLSTILGRHVHIDAIGRSAMRRVTFRHADREFAISLLNAIYHASDMHLKIQAGQRAMVQSAYLRAALDHVTHTDQRKALIKLLMVQERMRVLVAVDLPYAAEQIQQADAPRSADWPAVGLVLFFALFLGGFVGCSILYAMAVRQWLQRSR
jgi:uncharacterized protein involved in exopolysaccharide biosynthesis